MTDLEDAARAVASFDTASAIEDADAMAASFEAAGDRIARSLEAAARRGELSFNAMAETILKDLARVAVDDLVAAPLQQLIGELGSAVQGGSRSAPVINLTVSGSATASDFQRSEGQIAASLARAVSIGLQRT